MGYLFIGLCSMVCFIFCFIPAQAVETIVSFCFCSFYFILFCYVLSFSYLLVYKEPDDPEKTVLKQKHYNLLN